MATPTLVRLIAYAPNGASLGELPAPQGLSVGWVYNDLSALSFAYPSVGPKVTKLGQPIEVAVEVSNDGQTYAEPDNSRFLYLRDGRDSVRADSPWDVECLAYLNRLKKALIPFTGLDSTGRRNFTNQKVGAILNTLLTEAQARGALTGMTWNFTATTDSAGVPWANSQTVAYEAGKDFLAIVMEWVQLGLADVVTRGRQLRLYNPGGGSVDTTVATSPVTLRRGRDITEAPFRRTWENLADKAFVRGDSGINTTRTAAGALTPWGTQEAFVSAGGVQSPTTLAALGDAALSLTSQARTEYTYGLAFTTNPARPFREYNPGDWVYGVTNGAAPPERMRVRQITLTADTSSRVGGSVVLNDRFTESDIVQQRRLEALTSGATPAIGGSPTAVQGQATWVDPVGNVGAAAFRGDVVAATKDRVQVGVQNSGTFVVGTPLGTVVTYPLAFPSGSVPEVFATVRGTTASNLISAPTVTNQTETGCTIWITRTGGTGAVVIAWQAVLA